MADKPKNIRGAKVDPKGKSPTSRQLTGTGFWRKLAETVGIKGYENLSAKQIKASIPALSQKAVRQAIYNMGMKGATGGGIAGIALTLAGQKATDAVKKSLARQRVEGNRETQRQNERDAKKPDELQTEPMDSSKNRYLGPATKPKPKPMTDKQKIAKLKRELAIANAVGKVQDDKPIDKRVPGVKKSLKPKLRPNNLKDGGMPMVMKDGKKVPAYAADGVGKMNKGGMAMKKKPTTKMMAGGMAAKKKPAAKKMMAGGMAKKKMMAGGMTKSNYMYGGMAKKPKAKK